MAYNYNNNYGQGGNNDNELFSWIVVVIALAAFWPLGLVLLFRKLNGFSIGSPRRYQDRRDSFSSGTAPGSAAAGQTGTAQESSRTGGFQADGSTYHYKYDYRYQQPAGKQTQGAKQQAKPGMQGVYEQTRSKDGRFQKKRKKVDLHKGKGMTIWGSLLAGFFGFGWLMSFLDELSTVGFFSSLFNTAPLLGIAGLGLVLLICGTQRTRKAKRFRKYLALIGKRESVSVATLAQAMPVSYHTACDDLQEMLDEGYIPTGYLDMGSGRLILSDEGIQETAPEPEAVSADVPEEHERTVEDDNAILQEIRQVNDAIADPVMSAKIDRIEEITGKILDYQRKNPDKSSQLRSFLSYYLPTTLKILKAYAQMEAQGIEGENIRSAKVRIEGMMDKVVEGFEKQLDKLFQDDAMDITTDVEVLERMLDKDGLSGTGSGFTLGGV